ncbi:hypothetical protein D9M73_120920 [compost metagenome]
MLQLVSRQRVAQLRIKLLAPERRVGFDHRRPLRVKHLVGLPAGDDEVVDGPVALSFKPLLGAGLRAGSDVRPQILGLSEIGQGFLVEHDIAEEALLEMLLEVRRKLGVADDEVARRVEQARAVNHAVRRVIELTGHHEDRFGRTSEPVADLGGEACEDAQPERNVGDRRRRERRVDPVGNLDVDRRHHEAKIDQRRLQEPVEPHAKIERECDHQQRVDKAHHHHDTEERAVSPSPRPCRDGVEGIDEILAAADREDLQHRFGPYPALHEPLGVQPARKVERRRHAGRH